MNLFSTEDQLINQQWQEAGARCGLWHPSNCQTAHLIHVSFVHCLFGGSEWLFPSHPQLAFYMRGELVITPLKPASLITKSGEMLCTGLLFFCNICFQTGLLPLRRKYFSRELKKLISALSALLQHDDYVANRGRNVHLPTVASVKYTPRAFGARPSKTGRQHGVFTPGGGWGLFNSRVCAMDPQIGNTYHITARVKSYFVN